MPARQSASHHEGSAELPIHDVLRVLLIGQRRTDQQHALIWQAHDHAFNFLDLQAKLSAQRQRGIHTRMAIAAGRIGLHRGLHQLPRLAQILQHPLRRWVRGIGAEEPGLAFNGLTSTTEALTRDGRGSQPVQRAPAHLEALGPGAVGQELQAAGGLGKRNAESIFHLGRGKAKDAPRRRRRAKGAAGRGWVIAAVIVIAAG